MNKALRIFGAACFFVLLGCNSSRAGWQKVAPLPEPRWFHASGATVDGRILSFGGYILRDRKGLPQHGTGPYSLVIYNPVLNEWNRGPAVPPYHLRHVYDVFHDKSDGSPPTRESREIISNVDVPYEAPNGGSDEKNRVYWFGRSGPVVYDIAKRKWDQPPSPIYYQTGERYERSVPQYDRTAGATATGPDGRLYLIGGIGRILVGPGSEDRRQILNSVDVYNPKTNTWSQAAPMREARQLPAAVFGKDGKLYVFGGCACKGTATIINDDPEMTRRALIELLEERRSVKITEVYDPEKNMWQVRAPMPKPRQDLAAARGVDGKIYVIGGVPRYGEENNQTTVDVYDPTTDTWSKGPDLRTARHGHTAVPTPDGKIYVVGGYGKHGPLASVEVLDTAPKK